MKKTLFKVVSTIGIASALATGLTSCANTAAIAKAQPNPNSNPMLRIKNLYDAEQKQEVISLLKAPPTPVRTPDTILRVLILPYVNKKGMLVTSHYVFVDASEGKWILGNYLLQKGKSIKEINPLSPEK